MQTLEHPLEEEDIAVRFLPVSSFSCLLQPHTPSLIFSQYVIRHVLLGLEYLHRSLRLHRDIKVLTYPANTHLHTSHSHTRVLTHSSHAGKICLFLLDFFPLLLHLLSPFRAEIFSSQKMVKSNLPILGCLLIWQAHCRKGTLSLEPLTGWHLK